LLEIAWILLLVLPAATTLSAPRDWDIDPCALLFVSAWLILVLRLLVGGRIFFVMTLPIALLGVLCMGADFFRDADLLELLLQWRTFSTSDVLSALRPYAWFLVGAVVGVAGLCRAAHRVVPDRRTGRRAWAAVVVGLAIAAVLAPAAVWPRAWPADAILVATSAGLDSRALSQFIFPVSSTVNPRAPGGRAGGRDRGARDRGVRAQ
jgi:hypothetical protein